MNGFTHLHVHTEYSLLDGACRVKSIAALAKSMGQTSLAITDHGVMYGAVAFFKAAKEAGIEPIIGCECYVAARSRFDHEHALDGERSHLVLLCKDAVGYANLIKMVSRSWTEGFYTKPRIDHELLTECHEGLIALSGCLSGEVAKAILAGDSAHAEEIALWYDETFGRGNYYLEIQDHGLPEEREVIEGALRLSKKFGIPLVATNDVHYAKKKDAAVQRVLIAIQTNKTLNEENPLAFPNDEFYLKSEDEMRALFSFCPEAVDNTLLIAQKCNFEFEFGVTKLPLYDAPETDHKVLLRTSCEEGLKEKFKTVLPEYAERLGYELSVIDKMGFNDYFLIVADFVRYARKKGIPVGPGRGSAAGSLAAFALGITGIDPIKNKLLFERFLNPERVSMPDIDIDFCYERRGEVVDYVTRKYGADHVAQIVTFGTMLAKQAVRDAARAMGLPYSTGDMVAKQLSRDFPDIAAALKKNAELKKMYEGDENVRSLLDTAMQIEGMPRHASTHAAGVVITRGEVSDYVPLSKNGDQPVTQYTMTEIEELGLLKMDFLGLRTLTVINDAQREVQKTVPNFDIEKIPLDDPKVYAEMSRGNTVGIFQCESAGMTNLIVNMKPERFEDIAAAVALYRPGPMYFIDDYLKNRADPSRVTYRTPLLKDILDETNGCMVYQEQVMQVFRTLAGYSYGRADVVRRAMSKKKHDVMERERKVFIHGMKDENGNIIIDGAVRRGIDEKTADSIFSEMTSFASYGFNKSHTVAYGLIAYRTAYLKVNYPVAFLAALLTSVIGEEGKTVIYVGECQRLGIRVLPPHVNTSGVGFTVIENEIAFGLLGVKNLGRALLEKVVRCRKADGVFVSFWDFCRRVYGTELNRRALECLIKSGALDGLGLNRREMLLNLETVMDCASRDCELHAGGQLDLFSIGEGEDFSTVEPELQHCEELSQNDRLYFEKEVSGLYFSGHPLGGYRALSKKLRCPRIVDLLEQLEAGGEKEIDGRKVTLLVIVTAIKKKITKRDEMMAFCEIEDLFASVEMIVFPRLLTETAGFLSVGSILIAEGRLSVKDDELKFIPDALRQAPSEDESEAKSEKPAHKRRGLFIRLSAETEKNVPKLEPLLSIFEEGGDLPVYLYRPDEKKYDFLGTDHLIMGNEPLLRELKRLFGDENVVQNL